MYIESERVAATVYRRAGVGWETIEVEGGAARLQLASIGLDIALPEVYRGVPGLSA